MERKRHSAAKPVNRSQSVSIVTVIFVIASIVLIAAIIVLSPLGDYLMTNVISPILSCNTSSEDRDIVSALKQQDSPQASATPSPSQTEKTHQVITVEEKPFYILQMGAYTNAEAAGQHADEITRMGAGGTVFQDGSVFRVFAAAYTDEDSLMKVQSQVRSDGFEATPYITESKALRITLDGDAKAVNSITEAVQLISGLPTDLCTFSLTYDKGDLEETKLYSELQKRYDSCIKMIGDLEQIKTEEIQLIKDLLKKYAQNISTFLYEHDTIHTEMVSGSLKHLQLSAIIDYILFFDRK